MKKIFEMIRDNPLFAGIASSDFEGMLGCLSAQRQQYAAGDVILFSGDPVSFVGILLSGSAKIIKEDQQGNNTILAEVDAPGLFGEVFVCAGVSHSPVTVLAATGCDLLRIDYRRIITTCSAACPFHARLIENMLRLIANKSLLLNQKIEILSKRTTREKLLAFFDLHRGTARTFTIPYNREELAQYLCVDRSAMSSELGRMQREGLIRFEKNTFELLL